METGRECFNKFLKGEALPRPIFIPLLRGLASRVGGISAENLYNDPTLWANSITKTVDLFKFDGVVSCFNFSLLAEACGCDISLKDGMPKTTNKNEYNERPVESQTIKYALEASNRIFQVSRHNRACIASIPGPLTLSSQLFGEKEGQNQNNLKVAKRLVSQVAESFCEINPDALIFMEGGALGNVELNSFHYRTYNTVKNITRYYNVPTALYLENYFPQGIDRFLQLKHDIYIFGHCIKQSFPSINELMEIKKRTLGIGIGLPLNNVSQTKSIIESMQNYNRNEIMQGIFFTSLGPTTRNVDIDVLHQIVDIIKNNSYIELKGTS